MCSCLLSSLPCVHPSAILCPEPMDHLTLDWKAASWNKSHPFKSLLRYFSWNRKYLTNINREKGLGRKLWGLPGRLQKQPGVCLAQMPVTVWQDAQYFYMLQSGYVNQGLREVSWNSQQITIGMLWRKMSKTGLCQNGLRVDWGTNVVSQQIKHLFAMSPSSI